MSYLLKALEKAEQERQQSVTTEHSQPVVLQPTSHLPLGLVIAVVIILALTLWQAWPSSSRDSLHNPVHDVSAHGQQGIASSTSENVAGKPSKPPALRESKNNTAITPVATSAGNAVQVEPVKEKAKELSELTPQQLARIPSLNLASHIYSSARQYRSVVINDKTYQEGELIQAGLILDTINQSGIVINIHGQKVELPKGISWVASQNAQ